MKKTLVEMDLTSYVSDYGTLVARPAGVEPKYDEATQREIDDDYPHIPITKATKAEIDEAVNGGLAYSIKHAPKMPTRIEFGIETLENKSFSFCRVRLNQECQRWFLNIWSMDDDGNENVIYTSQDIDGVLYTLHYYLVDHNMSLVALNDFIEKLTTNENLQFIEKVTALPKPKQKNAADKGYKVLQSVENCEDLRTSLIGWLGNLNFNLTTWFIKDFNEALDTKEMDEVYKVVDKRMKPKYEPYAFEMERLLEWVNSQYDPRCLTDAAIRCINGGLDELAKEAIPMGKKSVGNDHIGGYYVKDTPENEHRFIVDNLMLDGDVIDFIDECGYEVFIREFNSVLGKMGFRFDEMLDVRHISKHVTDPKPEIWIDFVIEDINPQRGI